MKMIMIEEKKKKLQPEEKESIMEMIRRHLKDGSGLLGSGLAKGAYDSLSGRGKKLKEEID